MTPPAELRELHDRLRAALRETADDIPPEAPPLRLVPLPRRKHHARRRWTAWAAPVVSAALVAAVIAASVTLVGGLRARPATSGALASPGGLPPYYVALTTQKPDSDIYSLGATAAELRSTTTGAVLAKVTPPRPYVSFTGVTGAADDRTFVLSAQGPNEIPKNLSARQYLQKYPHGYYPAQRFFLLRIDPKAARRMVLTALPAAYTPANAPVHDMALSPDGTTLAADVGGEIGNAGLFTFDLATGAERAWSSRSCPQCFPSSGGLGYVGVNVDALSWTADSRHVAFVWGGTVRVLDTRAAGSDLLAGSKIAATWTVGPTVTAMWRGAIITPDGRTVLAIQEFGGPYPNPGISEHLVRFSTATGRQTAVINNLNVLKLNGYEQVLYTNPDGSLLVVTFLRPGRNATILHDGHQTRLPWSPYIGVAAW